MVPGQKYEFKFPVLPTEYTFPAGHQIGVVLLANYSMGVAGTRGAVVTVDTKASKVILPITGGSAAAHGDRRVRRRHDRPGHRRRRRPTSASRRPTRPARRSTTRRRPPPTRRTRRRRSPARRRAGTKFAVGTTTVTCTATDANGNASATARSRSPSRASTTATGDATGTVPATLSLTLGAPASFGAFTPGVTKDYTASTTANVISTRGRRGADGDPIRGHLTNGTFSLPSPLQPCRSRRRAWTAPVSNDPVDDRLHPAHRRHRCAAHGRVQQDADVHPLHHHAVAVCRPAGGYPHPRWVFTPT